MTPRALMAAAMAIVRTPLARWGAAASLVGVLSFALFGETPARGDAVQATGDEWGLPASPASPDPALATVWRAGVWSTQAAATPAGVETPQGPQLTLLGVIRSGGRLEAVIATDDGQRLRRVAGEALPGGGRLLRVAATEAAWADAEGKETVARLLAAPVDAPAAPRRPARR